ncbi:hypothetical protein F5Y10DRAFT_288584 [Nemania abortiva]|nr:hypothetical protein F5Y10DRAFT_288584 [Nemania abortiva]
MSSGPFYPDNPNRTARVRQLITQTTAIQSTYESTENQIKALTSIEQSVFDTLARAAGYPTAQQYIDAGLSTLTPAQKANYDHICSKLLANNPHLKNAMMATGIIAGVGWALKVIPKTMVAITCKISSFVHGVWGVLRGLVLIFKGSVEDGVAMVRGFATLIRVNWSQKLMGGVHVAENTATGLRWVKRAGTFLQWAGVIAEAALLVYTLVEGEKERDTLRNAIIETCSSRFGAKKIQLLLNQSMLWTSKITGVISNIEYLQDLKKEQEEENDPDIPPITQAGIDKSTLKGINKLVDDFDNELSGCNTDEKVLGELAVLDTRDAGGAWVNEDPNLDAMKKWIADHPFKDKDGNVVPIDGPISGNSGLKWTQNSTVKAGSTNTEIRITGTNADATKSQRFSSVHLSVPLSVNSRLFSKNGFKIAGTTDADKGDGTFNIQTSAGVTGPGKLSIVEKQAASGSTDAFLQFDYQQSEVLVPIDLPPNASITFVLKGTIGTAGKSALLIRENWWPDKNDEKVWEDCVIEKTA